MRDVTPLRSTITAAIFGGIAGGTAGLMGSGFADGAAPGAIAGAVIGYFLLGDVRAARAARDKEGMMAAAFGAVPVAGFVGGIIGSVTAHAGFLGGAVGCIAGYLIGLVASVLLFASLMTDSMPVAPPLPRTPEPLRPSIKDGLQDDGDLVHISYAQEVVQESDLNDILSEWAAGEKVSVERMKDFLRETRGVPVRALDTSENVFYRYAAALHPRVSDGALRLLAKDTNSRVRAVAQVVLEKRAKLALEKQAEQDLDAMMRGIDSPAWARCEKVIIEAEEVSTHERSLSTNVLYRFSAASDEDTSLEDLRRLAEDSNVHVREAVQSTLESMAARKLDKELDDSLDEVIAGVERGDEDACARLDFILQKTVNMDVHFRAASNKIHHRLAAALHPETSDRDLWRLTEDDNPHVRKAALVALEKRTGESSVPPPEEEEELEDAEEEELEDAEEEEEEEEEELEEEEEEEEEPEVDLVALFAAMAKGDAKACAQWDAIIQDTKGMDMEELIVSDNAAYRFAAAIDAMAPEDALLYLAEDENLLVRDAARKALHKLAARTSQSAQSGEQRLEEILAALAHGDNTKANALINGIYRENAGGSLHTLATSTNSAYRLAATLHLSVSDDDLRLLAKDANADIRYAAQRALSKRGKR
jgi:hypothetical protein